MTEYVVFIRYRHLKTAVITAESAHAAVVAVEQGMTLADHATITERRVTAVADMETVLILADMETA